MLKNAQTGQKRLLLGEDFAKVAKEMSEGPSASTGGGLGDLDASSLLPELARAARQLKVMEISAPIETQNGVHVIQIQKLQAKAPPPFEQRRNPIYQRLYQAEVERQMGLWIDELKKKSVIETRL